VIPVLGVPPAPVVDVFPSGVHGLRQSTRGVGRLAG
jgi:hypothetical protein